MGYYGFVRASITEELGQLQFRSEFFNSVNHAKPKEITISLTRDRNGLTLTVHDSGRGMARNRVRKGMGIHIMKYRANVIGGKLTVESKLCVGSTFSFSLPPAKSEDAK